MLQWRVRGSSGTTQSVGLAPPVLSGQVRVRLKEQMGIAATPAVDLLLFRESQPEQPLPDSLLIHSTECLLVQRRPSAEAQAALKEAEEFYQRQLRERREREASLAATADEALVSASSSLPLQKTVSSAPSVEAADAADVRAFHEAESGPAEGAEYSGSAEEERLLLQAVMAVHDSRKGFLREEDSSAKASTGGRASAVSAFAAPAASQQTAAAAAARMQSHFLQLQQQQQMQQANVSVPATYICHMCGEAGHHIRACPKANDQKTQKKIRPATGIPSSFLRDIAPEEIGKHQQVFIKKGKTPPKAAPRRLRSDDVSSGRGDGSCLAFRFHRGSARGRVVCDADGSFAVMRNEAGAASRAAAALAAANSGAGSGSLHSRAHWESHLKCALCRGLFNNPTSTPCCGETFCRSCIVIYLQQHSLPTAAAAGAGGASASASAGSCPNCGEEARLADLTANAVLEQSVQDLTGRSPLLRPSSAQPPQPSASGSLLLNSAAGGASLQTQATEASSRDAAGIAKPASNGAPVEEPAKGSLADLLQRHQNSEAAAQKANSCKTEDSCPSQTVSAVKTENADEKDSLQNKRPSSCFASETTAVLAVKSEVASSPQEDSEEVSAGAQSSREASLPSAASDVSPPAIDDGPQLSDLLHFKIPVAQILQQHKIAEEYIANYRKRKAEAAASGASP